MSTNNHQISVDEAVAMTSRYRSNRPDNFPICESFESDVISLLLSNPEVSYLRIYYGMDESNQVHAILVGANKDNEDILPSEPSATGGANTGDGSGLLEDGYRCPEYCPPPSKLNS